MKAIRILLLPFVILMYHSVPPQIGILDTLCQCTFGASPQLAYALPLAHPLHYFTT